MTRKRLAPAISEMGVIKVTWTSVNAAANGFSYDAAGNVVNDNLNQYLYDGEGRVCAVANTPAPGLTTMTGYVYDPDGNRVAKGTITTWSCDPSVNGLTTAENETEYILGLGGQPVTEMAQDANGSMQWQRSYVYAGGALIGTFDPSPNPAGQSSPAVPILSFRLTDWQGTLRATTDASGVPQGTCISLPFGDELTCQGNIPDGHHFTGKERDQESGNDYFGARYYTSNTGRFLTPDWAAKPITVPYASFGDPQTLNLYSYVENGPLNRVDAEGHATDQEGTSTQPVNLGGRCASFSKPDPDCSISSLADVAEVSADEAAYNAQVKQAFASTGNKVAQQQSAPAATVPLTLPPLVFDLPSINLGGILGAALDFLGDVAAPALLLASPASTASEAQDTIQQNTNPYTGPVSAPVIVVDPKGNATPVGAGEQLQGSKDGQYTQVKDANGKPTGTRIDGGHRTHTDPRAQAPHAHVPGATNPDGTPWLPVNQ